MKANTSGVFSGATVVPLILVLCLWGCSEGYPTEDLVDGGLLSPDEHIAQLNEMSAEVARKVRQNISLVENCLIRFTASRENVKPASVDVPLMDLDLTMSTDPVTQHIAIAVQTESAGDAGTRTVYTSSLWHHAVTFRSHLFQLQRQCAETQAPA